MTSKLMALGLLPLFALVACGDAAGPTAMESPVPVENFDTSNAMLTGQPISSAQGFADTVAASDWYEVEAGRLAQVKATTQTLKDFGRTMEKVHADSTAQLRAAADKAVPAIAPNPALSAEQEANLATLRDATGTDFDAAYKAQQISAHQMALAAMNAYAAKGDVPALKGFAAEAGKTVQMHLDTITGL
ncbi:MAG: DUF4142 domain-containing protein [Sphingomonadales bacterium]|nr:MAG: DUF4142 domain-containing protein [Sphingomonadales bacterium]